MAHIDYYFSTLSPFSYLAGTRLEEMAGRHGATITYKPLDIMALFPRTGGLPPGVGVAGARHQLGVSAGVGGGWGGR